MPATNRSRSSIHRHDKDRRPLLRRSRKVLCWGLLIVSFCAYVVVNSFWGYLNTGRWANFTPTAYHRALITPQGKTFLEPVSIFTHPWMIPVLGLLLGVMLTVPILVAVLYHLGLGICFAGTIAVVARAPMLGGVVAVGCVLGARTLLRRDAPFLGIVLGLTPTVTYLLLFGFTGTDVPALLALQRLALRGPLLIALGGGLLLSGLILTISQLTGFRAEPVLLLVMLLAGAPILVFFLTVGPAELEYALILKRLTPSGEIMQSVSLQQWKREHAGTGLSASALENLIVGGLTLHRNGLVRRCEGFLDSYPESKRTGEVLWIAARCKSLQFDRQRFAEGEVLYVDSYPLEESAEIWKRLRAEHPGSLLEAFANRQLGELALRNKQVETAEQLLRRAVQQLSEHLSASSPTALLTRTTEVFFPSSIFPGKWRITQGLFRAQRLLWLIERNELLSDPKSTEAIAALLEINPHAMTREDRYRRLGKLAGKYEDTHLSEDLKLAVARMTEDPQEKVAQLVALAKQWSDCDAAIEANYELGILVSQQPVLQLRRDVETPRVYFKTVRDAPPSPWRRRAQEHLKWLTPPPTPQR